VWLTGVVGKVGLLLVPWVANTTQKEMQFQDEVTYPKTRKNKK
jgi:hypothetical protein